MANKTKKNPTPNPFGLKSERRGRGRKQVGANFVKSVNSEVKLTQRELRAMRDFYQASAVMERQFMGISREQGCYR
jgi:hypothetical protein